MAELDWSQRDLAKAVGCSQPAIAWVFRPTAKQSALLPRIHKALGLTKPTPPATEAVAPLRAELDEMLENASDEVLEHIVATVKLITGTKKSE